MIDDVAGELDIEKIMPLIRNIFGIGTFLYAVKTTERDLEKVRELAADFFVKHAPSGTFRVDTKRSDKQYPQNSNEISTVVGAAVLLRQPERKVKMKNPDVTLWVEIRNDIYFYTESEKGEGGLPYGSSGKGMLLLSGGFDSPVAGYLCARRGVEILPVYFHSPPFVSEKTLEKVRDLTRQLTAYTSAAKLFIVPFSDVQLYLHENVPGVKLTIFLKRAMLRIADKLANLHKAKCVITGDAIGQVASQTLASLAAMNSATRLPILRPLTAMDKQDILDIAKRIDTYDISARPYDDCCTLFVAKHPELKPNAEVIEKIEARLLEYEFLIKTAVENTVVEDV